jgi:hypothetical protein
VCLIVCDLKTSTMRPSVSEFGSVAPQTQTEFKDLTWTELLPIGVQVLPLIGL